MKYFFYDFEKDGLYGAPDGFVVSVMVSLDSTLYAVGDQIIAKGQSVKEIYFVLEGNCDLFGYFVLPDTGETMRFKLVTLYEGSWYGDY